MTDIPKTLRLQPVVAASLQQWHHMLQTRDMSILAELLDQNVVFRSPMAHRP